MQHVAERWSEQSSTASDTLSSSANAKRIDELRKAPELLSSHEYLKLVEGTGGIGFDCYDLETGMVSPSPGFCQIYGLVSTEPKPLAYFQSFVHPDDRHTGQFGDVLARNGEPLTREMRIVRPDGIMRWLAFKGEVVHGRDLRPERVIGLWTDVTDSRATSQAMFHSRARFQAIAKACSAVVWTASPSGSQFSMDAAEWCNLTGQIPDEAQNKGWIEAIHSEDRLRLINAWRRSCESGCNLDEDVRLEKAEPTTVWLKVRAMALRQSDGRIVEWLGIVALSSLPRTHLPEHKNAHTRQTLTCEQIRAARGMLGWSAAELAEASRVSVSTIRRVEEQAGPVHLRVNLESNIRKAFEQAGVDFTYDPNAQPGVRPR